MKIISLVVFLLFTSLSFSQAQEWYFQYNIELKAQDTSIKAKRQVAMLRNSKMELYIAPQRSRMDFTLGKISKYYVIIDRNKNIVLSLNDSYTGKHAILGKPKSQQKSENNAKITVTTERKTILGYNCKKVIVEEKGKKAIYWITNDIKVNIKDIQLINSNLPGFPVAFSKVSDGVLMTFQLSNVKNNFDKPLNDIFFTKVPEGYQLIQAKQN